MQYVQRKLHLSVTETRTLLDLAAPAVCRAVPHRSAYRDAIATLHVSDMRIWGALAIVYVVWGSTFAAIELAVRDDPAVPRPCRFGT